MEYNKENYINRKVIFFPNDSYRKEGYIRNIDDLGYTYEVTAAFRDKDKGIYFRNHASNFSFQFID